MTGHQITYIGWVAFPFFLLMALMVALLFFMPDLALWLPRKMM
jgi:TRAP-type C4-dicarboxylate transport system permease large subunit